MTLRSTSLLLAGMAVFCASCEEVTVSAPITDGDRASSNLHSISPISSNLNQFFECLESEGVTLVSAHRGGDPENTISGMANTLASVPAIMEIDVATTADGEMILMHDDTLDRTTTGTGVVENTSYAKISKLKIKATGDHVPTFAEALAWAKDKTILQVDFKPSTDYDDVIAEVKRQKATGRVIYIAYTLGQARLLHKKHPAAMISVTLDDTGDLSAAKSKGIPENAMLGWTGNERPSQVVFDHLNKRDIEVIFGTLGGRNSIDNQIERSRNETQYADIAKMGVDVLATDRPVEALAALRKAGLSFASKKCGVN